jgi:hypothetical protein
VSGDHFSLSSTPQRPDSGLIYCFRRGGLFRRGAWLPAAFGVGAGVFFPIAGTVQETSPRGVPVQVTIVNLGTRRPPDAC